MFNIVGNHLKMKKVKNIFLEVKTVKESYFTKTATSEVTSLDGSADDESIVEATTSNSMAAYTQAITKSIK